VREKGWSEGKDTQSRSLELDETRINEVDEAWVPVITPFGSGTLVWKNSD